MKKILTPLLFIFSVCVNAQEDTLGIRLSDSTAIGAPDGKPVSKQIGIAGGAIISDDGRVELIFPAGALTATTNISIQPATNLAPNGTGKAYQFEPSGIQFKKPVQIIFHYTDEEAEECPADLMAFAMQDHSGKWAFFNYDEWDSVGKVLKGVIKHFSGLSNVHKLRINFVRKSISVEDTTMITIVDISRRIGNEPRYETGQLRRNSIIVWFVNEVRDGSPQTGRVGNEYHGYFDKGKTLGIVAVYKAPVTLPRKNPVTVTAIIYLHSSKKQTLTLQKKIKAIISIYDLYKVTVSGTKAFREAMGTEMADSASFNVRITPQHISLEEVKNYPPVVISQGSRIGCSLEFLTGLPAVGFIHITESGIRKSYLSKDDPPEVFIDMKIPEILMFKFRWVCRRVRTDPNFIDLNAESPLEIINFIANGQTQRISEQGRIKYLTVVTPVRP